MNRSVMAWSAASVRDLRKRLGLTQERFAQALGVAFSTVNRLENDRSTASPLLREKLSKLAKGDGGEAGD